MVDVLIFFKIILDLFNHLNIGLTSFFGLELRLTDVCNKILVNKKLSDNWSKHKLSNEDPNSSAICKKIYKSKL